ncbi:MAG: YeeE/YedE thiosulfate transporter family protein [Thermoplasmata archaeon]
MKAFFSTAYFYGIVLAITSFLLALFTYMLTGTGLWWGVTGAESQMGGVFWSFFGLKTSSLAYYHVYPIPAFGNAFTWFLVFGIILGPLLVSSFRREFSIRQVPNRWLFIQALAGGILIGYGTRMAGGCNIGDFNSGFATGSMWAFPFFFAMIAGIYVIISGKRYMDRHGVSVSKVKSTMVWPGRKVQLSIFGTTLAVIAIMFVFTSNLVRLWLAFGLTFGSVGYLGVLCFQTSFRETLGETRDRTMAKALAVSFLIFSVISQIAILGFGMHTDFFFDQSESVLYQTLGGFIFGLGMGLAFNCTFSMEWRMGSGNVQAVITFIGLTFIGAPLYAVTYGWWHSIIPVVVEPSHYWYFSLYRFGVPGAILIDLFPAVWLIYSMHPSLSLRRKAVDLAR